MDRVMLACLAVAAAAAGSLACSCGYGLDERDVYCSYDAIVEGMALVEYVERQRPVEFRNPLYDYLPYDRFYVIRVDKAIKIPENLEGREKITLITPGQESMCGIRFHLDINMTFFARLNDKGELWTGLCDADPTLVAMATQRVDCNSSGGNDNGDNGEDEGSSGEVPPPPANQCQTPKPRLLSKKDRHLGLRS